ncbi:hypothetical protein [uncultured Maribacter sp.]
MNDGKNTIIYEQLHGKMSELFSTGNSVEKASENLKSISAVYLKSMPQN